MVVRTAMAGSPPVVISEIAAFEKSGYEWIEVVNRADAAFDLSDWVFWEDDTNHGLQLVQGADRVVEPGEYALIVQDSVHFLEQYPFVTSTVFDSSWGSLKEGGETIGIKNASGKLIELLTYGEAKDGSLQRIDLGTSGDSKDNWFIDPRGATPGAANTAVELVEATESATHSVPPPAEILSASTSSTAATSTLVHAPTTTPEHTAENPDFSAPTSSTTVELAEPTVSTTPTSSLFSTSSTPNSPITNTPTSSADMATSTRGNIDVADTATTTHSATSTELIQEEVLEASHFMPGSVVINELVSDPRDGEVEFVELFNAGTSTMMLADWRLIDGSGSATLLTGSLAPGAFMVIEKTKGNLNNAGEQLLLVAPDQTEIDTVAYGNWDSSAAADNAPVAADPYSLARRVDGQDTNNDAVDFAVTEVITKGVSNVIAEPIAAQPKSGGSTSNSQQNNASTSEANVTQSSSVAYRQHVFLHEILPNPAGTDTDDEFIEIINRGSVRVDLEDWQLGDATARRYTITETELAPGEIAVFFRADTKIALNNSGTEIVQLFAPDGTVVDSVTYGGVVPVAESYVRTPDDSWQWTYLPTPGEANHRAVANAVPVVSAAVPETIEAGDTAMFDAADSTDPDGDRLEFSWHFPDGDVLSGETVEYVFNKTGEAIVVLEVSDSAHNTTTEQFIITVTEPAVLPVGGPPIEAVYRVVISEIFPNPKGSDDAEFIELFNPGPEPVDLYGFKLDDRDGGSKPYTFPEYTIIPPGVYRTFGKEETGLTLNNTTDSVRLLLPDLSLVQEMNYDTVIEDFSYVRGQDGVWVWTAGVTPGTANIIIGSGQTESSVQTRVKADKRRNATPTIVTTISELTQFDVGDHVRVSGVVTALPGQLGPQYFYVTDPATSTSPAGVQVYLHKKDFPELTLGEVVAIDGELSVSRGERRLKLQSKEQITQLGAVAELAATEREIYEIVEADVGSLLVVEGEITALKSTYMYVDDGSEEIKVYFKQGAGISRQDLHEGDTVRVQGVLGVTKNGVQLLPRAPADIELIARAAEVDSIPVVIPPAAPDSKDLAETYLAATAAGLSSILIGLVAKTRASSLLGLGRNFVAIAANLLRRRG